MGILQLYPEKEYYTSVKPQQFCPGQFCWLPVANIDPIPRILDVERSKPTEHESVKFELRNANRQHDFTQRDRILPIKSLNLRSHEELLVQRAKRRPGIIISSKVDLFGDIAKILPSKGKKHLQEDCLFVIPGYSTENGPSGFPPEMVLRTRCLMYRQFFYYPANTLFKEGVARFDRIQVITGRDPAAIKPTNICLSEDVFNLFMSMFLYCISGVEDKDVATARDLIMQTYPT